MPAVLGCEDGFSPSPARGRLMRRRATSRTTVAARLPATRRGRHRGSATRRRGKVGATVTHRLGGLCLCGALADVRLRTGLIGVGEHPQVLRRGMALVEAGCVPLKGSRPRDAREEYRLRPHGAQAAQLGVALRRGHASTLGAERGHGNKPHALLRTRPDRQSVAPSPDRSRRTASALARLASSPVDSPLRTGPLRASTWTNRPCPDRSVTAIVGPCPTATPSAAQPAT